MFIKGDQISIFLEKEGKNKINGTVVFADASRCVISYKNTFYYAEVSECKFRYVADRKKLQTLGAEEFKKVRLESKRLVEGNLVKNKNLTLIINKSKGNSLTFITEGEKENYHLKYVMTAVMHYKTGKSVLFELLTGVIKKDTDILDYFTNDIIPDFTRAYSLAEFMKDSSLKIHYTTNKSILSNYPHIVLNNSFSVYLENKKVVGILNRNQADIFGNYFLPAISKENLLENEFVESKTSGYFFHKSSSIRDINRYYGYQEFKNVCKDKIGGKSSSFISTEGLKYTFGIEIEMQQCYIPTYLRPLLNVSCVRDGSINNKQGDRNGGPEFVTGVLTGDSGFIHLNKLCNEITQRGVLDQSCGLHVHIGGASFSNKFLVMSYLLGTKLEKEFFELVPMSRRNSRYCSALKDLAFNFKNLQKSNPSEDLNIRCDNYYKELFKYLCGQYPDNSVNKFTNHPRGRTMGYNHSTPRYNWLNFLPAMFDTKGVPNSWTLEFRLHSGTSNFNKIKNWIKVCMAFVYFADNFAEDIIHNRVTFSDRIEPLTVNNIIKKVFPKTSSKLIAYLEDRKCKFCDPDEEIHEYKQNKLGVVEYTHVKEILE